MSKKTRNHTDDLRGATRLAVEATRGVTALVEKMHVTIASGPALLGQPLATPARLATRTTSFAHSNNDSNVDMFNYNRNTARLGLRRDF